MFSEAHKEALKENESTISVANRLQISAALPDKYTLRDLELFLNTLDHSNQALKLSAFIVVDAALSDARLQPSDDTAIAALLSDRIVASLKPNSYLLAQEDSNYNEDDRARCQSRDASLVALKSLARLLDINAAGSSDQKAMPTSALISLLAFTDPEAPWSSQEASKIACEILARYGQRASTAKFITEDILQDHIRPLFRNSRPSTVTEQGRKVTVERLPSERLTRMLNPVKKPWTFESVGAPTVLRWAICKSNKEVISSNWHLFIPPVLTLLDDPVTPVRLSGMAALSDLLDRVPPKMLEQTGLGDVMEEAMIPTLSFLPTLTPADESLLLLKAAYDTLLKLTQVRFGDEKLKERRHKVLDKLLREGVLHGMNHCHQNVEIMRLLLVVMEKLIYKSDAHFIKHLKDVTPVLYTLLMDPFAPTNPENLIQTIKTLKAVVLSCWPVLSQDRHRIELLKAMSVCWLHLSDERQNCAPKRSTQLDIAQHELKIAAALFSKSMPSNDKLTNEVKQLIRVEPKVGSLFDPAEADAGSV